MQSIDEIIEQRVSLKREYEAYERSGFRFRMDDFYRRELENWERIALNPRTPGQEREQAIGAADALRHYRNISKEVYDSLDRYLEAEQREAELERAKQDSPVPKSGVAKTAIAM